MAAVVRLEFVAHPQVVVGKIDCIVGLTLAEHDFSRGRCVLTREVEAHLVEVDDA
jgi:hypothetical protein